MNDEDLFRNLKDRFITFLAVYTKYSVGYKTDKIVTFKEFYLVFF